MKAKKQVEPHKKTISQMNDEAVEMLKRLSCGDLSHLSAEQKVEEMTKVSPLVVCKNEQENELESQNT